MLAAVYYNNRDIRLEEMPVPQILSGEILLKMMAGGICGSDVMEWYRVPKAPLVLGHEVAGEIAEIGPGVEGLLPGERVFVSHHVPCNECHYCRKGSHTACQTLHTTNFDPGGFAEYIRVPELNVKTGVFKLPENVSFEEGTFIEPLACAVRAQRLAGTERGDCVLVLGSGISGLLHIKLAKAHGASSVIATDISGYRLKAAVRFGANLALQPEDDIGKALRTLNRGRLADKVIICASVPEAFKQAFELVDNGGTVIFFAPTEPGRDVPVPVTELWRKEVTMMTSYGAGPDDLKESLEFIASGKVCVLDMVTHRLPLSEAGEGFRLVAEGKESIKVLLYPHGVNS